jgi:putative ABC transport system substrate-binding protein
VIRRRDVLASALLLASPAVAQRRNSVARVAVLEWESASGADRLIPFRDSLRAEGFVEGQNIFIQYFFAEGRLDSAEAHAAEIMRGSFDIVVAFATPAAHAVKRAGFRIPVVFGSADPLGTGLITNLARPGGNMTGVSSMISDLEGKRVELLRQLLPNATRAVYLGAANDLATDGFIRQAQEAGGRIGIDVLPAKVANADGIEAALLDARRHGAQAAIVQPLFTLSNHSAAYAAEIMGRNRMPAIGTYATFARAGGLISYGPALDFARRRAAQLVARILNGASAGDLPVEQPTEFQLVVNAKAGRELGVSIPALLLARADEVIE